VGSAQVFLARLTWRMLEGHHGYMFQTILHKQLLSRRGHESVFHVV
jgi:hypothetical protein